MHMRIIFLCINSVVLLASSSPLFSVTDTHSWRGISMDNLRSVNGVIFKSFFPPLIFHTCTLFSCPLRRHAWLCIMRLSIKHAVYNCGQSHRATLVSMFLIHSNSLQHNKLRGLECKPQLQSNGSILHVNLLPSSLCSVMR